ncbi:MAG: KpsF/GutQ family sugar-phosphate isomerase [Kiritimatiellae bacterium]|nr:KpsF/GutQ family sugar-phosphate isomerase [Kiritimatiellia bacterium]
MKAIKRAREVLAVEILEINRVKRSLDKRFSRATRLILESLKQGGKIVVTGVGKSYYIGQKISATLSSTGSPSVVLHPSQAMHGDLGIIGKADVLLALSYSGESDELLAIIPAARRQGAKIIVMTGVEKSAAALAGDEIIHTPVAREACPFNLAPTASTTAALAVGDALAIVLLEARGFKKEDYAKLHPGGAIGRTLLLKVADIMRQGDRLASVPVNAKVKDAILAMTSARSGSVGVVNKMGRIAGIFTDGDLRRMISRKRNIPEWPVRSVMTPHPVTIRENALAIDALKIYEERDIDDLLVIDSAQRLVGMVDIQDLPKFKIL